jgi:hypothetical protein
MRSSLTYGLKETVAAAVLSSFIAGGVGAVTGPATTKNADSVTISVNRTYKGDRQPQAVLPHQHPNNASSTPTSSAPPTRAPLGCDPAFSPIVEPARAAIYKRCMV